MLEIINFWVFSMFPKISVKRNDAYELYDVGMQVDIYVILQYSKSGG